jgi:hypothetical protein
MGRNNIMKLRASEVARFLKRTWAKWFIVCVALILASPALRVNEIAVGSDDFQFHINRLRSFWNLVANGQFLPQIDQLGYFSMGIAVHETYPPLTSILTLLPKAVTSFLGASSTYVASNTLVLFIFIGSGLTMLHFVTGVLDMFPQFSRVKNYCAVAGALAYISMPYLFLEVYSRYAIAEALCFVWTPLFFLGLFNVVNGRHAVRYLTVSMTATILTHQLSVVVYGMFGILFLVFYVRQCRLESVKKLLLSTAASLGLSAFWLFPFLELWNVGIYSMFMQSFEQAKMQTVEFFAQSQQQVLNAFSTLPLFGVFDGNKASLGVWFWLTLALLFLVYVKLPTGLKKTTTLLFGLGFFGVLLTTDVFFADRLPHFFVKFQFAFRFLEFSSFAIAAVFGIALGPVLLHCVEKAQTSGNKILPPLVKLLPILAFAVLSVVSTNPIKTPLVGQIDPQYTPDQLAVEGDAVPNEMRLQRWRYNNQTALNQHSDVGTSAPVLREPPPPCYIFDREDCVQEQRAPRSSEGLEVNEINIHEIPLQSGEREYQVKGSGFFVPTQVFYPGYVVSFDNGRSWEAVSEHDEAGFLKVQVPDQFDGTVITKHDYSTGTRLGIATTFFTLCALVVAFWRRRSRLTQPT